MPGFVMQALLQRKLVSAYRERPPYQQNDYIGWILQARREDTREQRLAQMLDELAAGGLYMRMEHAPSRRD